MAVEKVFCQVAPRVKRERQHFSILFVMSFGMNTRVLSKNERLPVFVFSHIWTVLKR